MLSVIADFCNILASGWHVWPSTVLTGLTYFFTALMNFDFLLNVKAMLQALSFLFGFLVIYYGIKLFLKIMNFFRGSGNIDV